MAMPPPSGRSRSLPRMRTAGQRTTHPVCVEVHAHAARFVCVAALGRRQAAARQLASCYPRAALRADAALGVQTELVVVGNHGLAQPAKGRRRKRRGRACEEVWREIGGRAEGRACCRAGRQAPWALPQGPTTGPLRCWGGARGRSWGPGVVPGLWVGRWGIQLPIPVQAPFSLTYCHAPS